MMNSRTPESVNGAISATKLQNSKTTSANCSFEQFVDKNRAYVISTVCQRYASLLLFTDAEEKAQDTCPELWHKIARLLGYIASILVCKNKT